MMRTEMFSERRVEAMLSMLDNWLFEMGYEWDNAEGEYGPMSMDMSPDSTPGHEVMEAVDLCRRLRKALEEE